MVSELNIPDLYEKSNNDIAVELGRRFRDYRIALRMTQKDVALQSGVSIMTIVRFEKGDGTSIKLDNFISIMRAIQKLEGIAEAIPDIPLSLYDKPEPKTSSRVRKRSYEK